MNEPRVFGIKSPWSGDEHDPIPWTYWAWVRTYWAARKSRHAFGLHDWRVIPVDGSARCDWCGAQRPGDPEVDVEPRWTGRPELADAPAIEQMIGDPQAYRRMAEERARLVVRRERGNR